MKVKPGELRLWQRTSTFNPSGFVHIFIIGIDKTHVALTGKDTVWYLSNGRIDWMSNEYCENYTDVMITLTS